MTGLIRGVVMLGAGIFIGISLGVGQGVKASKEPANSLPLDDLRTFLHEPGDPIDVARLEHLGLGGERFDQFVELTGD